MKKLKSRWGINSNYQLTVIFIVFAITGSTSAYLSKPLAHWMHITPETLSWFYWPISLVLIFPIYQVLLVIFGWLFGQFTFFWWFEKKMLRSIGLRFLVEKSDKVAGK